MNNNSINNNPDNNVLNEAELKERRESRKIFSFIGLSLALPLIFIVGLRVAAAAFCPIYSETDVLYQTVFSLALYLLFIPAGYLILRRVPKSSRISAVCPDGGFPVFVILLAVAVEMAVVGMYMGDFIDYSFFSSSASALEDMNYKASSSLGNGLYFLYILAVAPVVEELFFRKALCDILRRWGTKPAIILSAFFYAAFHGNLTQFFYSFGLGLVLSYAYLRNGKLKYPLIIHFVFNLLFSAIPLASEIFLCSTEVLSEFETALQEWVLSFYTKYENLQSVISANPGIMPAYIVNFVISCLTMGLAVGGAAALMLSRRQVKFFSGEKRLKGKNIGDTVFMAHGMMLFMLCSIILTVLSIYNI